MRLFVGFRPSQEAIAHLSGAVARIAPRGTARITTAPAFRWIPSERWHITCAFLGDVDSSRIRSLIETLEAVGRRHSPLHEVRLSGSGTFPGVLYIGLEPSARHSATDQLARDIQRSVRAEGTPVERRPWRGHLTVARSRGGDLRPLADELSEYDGPPWVLAEFALVRSSLGSQPTYEDLLQVRLTGG